MQTSWTKDDLGLQIRRSYAKKYFCKQLLVLFKNTKLNKNVQVVTTEKFSENESEYKKEANYLEEKCKKSNPISFVT